MVLHRLGNEIWGCKGILRIGNGVIQVHNKIILVRRDHFFIQLRNILSYTADKKLPRRSIETCKYCVLVVIQLCIML